MKDGLHRRAFALNINLDNSARNDKKYALGADGYRSSGKCFGSRMRNERGVAWEIVFSQY